MEHKQFVHRRCSSCFPSFFLRVSAHVTANKIYFSCIFSFFRSVLLIELLCNFLFLQKPFTEMVTKKLGCSKGTSHHFSIPSLLFFYWAVNYCPGYIFELKITKCNLTGLVRKDEPFFGFCDMYNVHSCVYKKIILGIEFSQDIMSSTDFFEGFERYTINIIGFTHRCCKEQSCFRKSWLKTILW